MRPFLRFSVVIAAATMGAIAVAPAMAAAPVSRAGANAVTVALAGNEQGTGNVTATNDGSGEKKSGDAAPPVSALQGQSLFAGGVLAQEATANAAGHSTACAGVAGHGGSVVNIGGSRCLSPGTEVHATLSSLDLSNLVVADPDSALAPLNQGTDPILDNLQPAIDGINSGLGQVREQFGDLGLVAGFGTVEGRCTASPAGANGSATLVDAGIRLQLPDTHLTLLDFPVNPPPNTHLATDLSDVLDMVLDAVDADVTVSLDGALNPIADKVTPELRKQVVDNIRSQVEENLAPLEDNVLDVTLNKQSRTPGAIRVNAVDMQVLPAAREQVGASAAALQIGNAVCGPNGRVAAAAPSVQAPQSLPTAVSAGLATAPDRHSPGQDSRSGVALAALAMMLAGGAALVGIRWLRG